MTINDYLTTIAAASALGIVADIINDAFLKKNRGIEKYIKFGITICIASSIILPLLGIWNVGSIDLSASGEYQTAYNENTDDGLYILEAECESGLTDAIITETSAVPLSVEIEMALNDDVPILTCAKVVLEKSDYDKKELVEKTALEAIGTPAEVIIQE